MTRPGSAAVPIHAWIAAALVLANLLACAGGSRPQRSVLAGNPAQNILILPLNVAAVMPAELEEVSPVVWAELERYLRAQGKELKTVKFADARSLWLESIQEVRAADARAGYDDASRVLALKLARHASFDALIAPSLYLRKALISGRSARWDGVERTLEIEGGELLPDEIPLEGAAPAASLHAVILDAEGRKLQEVIGGLDLLAGVRVARSRGSTPSGISIEYTPFGEIFANSDHLQQGIALALAPFLPPLPQTAGGE